MKFLGWCILIFYFIMTSVSNDFEVYFGMLVGLSMISLGYYLEKR